MKSQLNVLISFGRLIFVMTIGVLWQSCSHPSKSQEFKYLMKFEHDSVGYFLYRRVNYVRDRRVDSLFFKDSLGMPENITTETYQIVANGVNRSGPNGFRPFLLATEDFCGNYSTNSELDEVLSTQMCYAGKIDTVINGDNFTNLPRFIKTQGITNPIQSIVIFDSAYVPLLEYYIKGYAPAYTLTRINDWMQGSRALPVGTWVRW